ncbi:hypothetical protein ST47_g6010 [Ascochyta rabiei]|uniref:Uncharacterized protein n=1 Tax=Didymella rabiei TaxID=5454 RepID=A0A163D1P2_DIDRA|nr:hypothetical protein ST47_g6010 [Ascochyta rabiei]
MAERTYESLLEKLKGLFECADYSDFTITCGVETFRVHKAIVCSQSEFFKRAERFPVGTGAANGTIDLPEDDPAVIKLLFQYLYEAEYEPMFTRPDPSQCSVKRIQVQGRRLEDYHYCFPHTCSEGCLPPGHKVCPHHECRDTTCQDSCTNFVCKECCPDHTSTVDKKHTLKGDASRFILHSKMYEIGDKYDVAGLKELARSKFIYACSHWWNTEYFAPAAQHAFFTTPESDRGLRDIISTTISRHIDLLNQPEVEAVLNEFNGLAVGILKLRAHYLAPQAAAPPA